MKRTSLVFVALLTLAAPHIVSAQDTLETANTLYQSAAYDEALVVLGRLRTASPSFADAQTMAQLRAYCLLALDRQTEAETAIEQIVKADLFFVPSETDVSPRVRAAVQSVRRRLLPAAAQAEYAIAKATFDRKEFALAADQFERVTALLRDPQLDGAAGMADLRVLSAGFRDLARAAATPPPALVPEAPPAPVAAPPPAPADKVYDLTEPGITPPVVERQKVPHYPGKTTNTAMNRRAALDLVIDETGRVEKVSLRPRIEARYDALLLAAATTWRYTPARTSDGRPVKFFKRLQITIQ